MKTEKAFDAVAMVRGIRDRHYEETKRMSSEEKLQYYRQKGRKAQEELASKYRTSE